VVLGSREEVAGLLDPVVGLVREAMARAIPRVDEELGDRLLGARDVKAVLAEVRAESLDMFRAAVQARIADAGVELTSDEAARLIVALDDNRIRDEVLTWFEDDVGAATRSLLLDLARRSVLPFQAAALTVLGWLCYLQGDGVFAGIAIDRALTADPDYSLAGLLDQVLTGAVNPSTFQDSLRAIRKAGSGAA
jgi:hypothetical protein